MAEDTKKVSKMNAFQAIGNLFTKTGLGLTDPAALAQMNQKAAQEQQQLLQQQNMQAITAFILQDIQTRRGASQPVVAPQQGAVQGPSGIQGQEITTGQTSPVTPSLVPKGQQRQFEKDIEGTRSVDVNIAKIPVEVAKQKALIPGTAASSAEQQAAKAGELMSRQAGRAGAATGTAMEAMINFGTRQLELTGGRVRPGTFFGIVDKLIPSEKNEYKEAFKGAAIESAALTARQLIPGVRAARITKIFKGSTAQLGKTAESNAANVAASMQNAFTGTLTENTLVEDEQGNKVRIQDVAIDPQSGKTLSSLGFEQRNRAINRLGKEFKERTRMNWLKEVFKGDPRLLPEKSIKEISNLAPKFNTVEELNASNIPVGEIVIVGGQIGVKE